MVDGYRLWLMVVAGNWWKLIVVRSGCWLLLVVDSCCWYLMVIAGGNGGCRQFMVVWSGLRLLMAQSVNGLYILNI